MAFRVSVAGASGYAGGELLRLLSGHPALELGHLAAQRAEGEPVAGVHPHLPALQDRRFGATAAPLLADADLVFLALPHGASGALAAALPPDVRVVDLGADHRLRDPAAWARHYGGEHAGAWTYGLPELPGARAAIAGASRVAAPGCHATAAALAFAPLLAAGLVDPDALVAVSATGVSGAGRTPTEALLGAQVMGDLAAYKVGTHQHVAEITQTLGDVADRPVRLTFTPVLAPLPRGILLTATAPPAAGGAPVAPAAVTAALRRAYPDDPAAFVRVCPDGCWPHTAATIGGNSAAVAGRVDASSGWPVVVVALDNLGKGAAGQAVQCANLMLGLPEQTGLSTAGVAP